MKQNSQTDNHSGCYGSSESKINNANGYYGSKTLRNTVASFEEMIELDVRNQNCQKRGKRVKGNRPPGPRNQFWSPNGRKQKP